MRNQKTTDAFFNSFHLNHVILYVGQSIGNAELKEYIAKCPWSAVITSRRDPEFTSFFIDENRASYEYSKRTEILAKPLNRSKLPILRLFGVEGHKEDKEDDLSWLYATDEGSDDSVFSPSKATEMLSLLPDLLDQVNPLVVVGIDSDVDWKLFGAQLTPMLYKSTSDGSVTFWDMPSAVEPQNAAAFAKLRLVAEKKKFPLQEEKLADVIRSRQDDPADSPADETTLPDTDNDVYYQGRIPVSISQSDLLLFKNVGTLLTERTINRIRPLGRVLQRQWFTTFLESGASLGPQWYGYLPQSTFYVKRSYQDALVRLVENMLEGRDILGNRTQIRPIVLSGDPGSSKSITLAALAYTIFSKHINPVIYISSESFLSANIGTGIEELDEAMQLIEQNTAADTRILLVWDSSTYRTGIDRARKLLERLQNRGRRFVLVCSSYAQKEVGQVPCYRLPEDASRGFVPCPAADAQAYEKDGCFIVKAIRQMNDREIAQFWQIAKLYSGINEATLSQFRKKLQSESNDEIFDYYYLLISILRDKLEQGLRAEQSKVSPYVAGELKKALGGIKAESKAEKALSPMYQAFLAAGLDPSLLPGGDDTADEQAEDEEVIRKLDDFNLCVALFSRFKLSVPYGLAYAILAGRERSGRLDGKAQDLFRIVTSDIPWIYYGEDEDGEFSFRFRNPLEADIFLRNHDFTGDQQIDLLCWIIDIYGSDYRRSKCMDLSLTENLQALLRMIGPNSGYTPFQTTRQHEHRCILEKLDYLIEKIQDLDYIYGVPDEDAGFASIIVTFTREYYGSKWNTLYPAAVTEEQNRWDADPEHYSVESYEHRISQMIYAITLAEKSVESLELKEQNRNNFYYDRPHLVNQRYSLAVEIAQCNIRLEEMIDEYTLCCSAHGAAPKKELTSRKLRYPVLYRLIFPLIISNPTNGYAYNALFKAFEHMYQRENLSESKKLQYLSEIMQVIETCETLDSEITSRGSNGADELTDHINIIKDLSTGLQITLSSVIRHRKGEPASSADEQTCFEIFDEMLEANNAAAITFICQKELQIPKGTRKLNDAQLLRCRSVYNFMHESENFECVCSNAYALAMLIRVSWMLYNGTTLTASPECQLTRLSHRQWVEINQLCTKYYELNADSKQPLIILLYALSTLQMSDLAEYGYEEAMTILSSLDEESFYQRRMWTPFILCGEDGNPYEFTGTVLSTKDNGGFIRVAGVPLHLKNNTGVRFSRFNLGRAAKMPAPNQAMKDLELGIGYTGFSVYSHAGRKEQEAKA